MRRWVNATAWVAGDGDRIRDVLANGPAEWLPPRAASAGSAAGGSDPDGSFDVQLRLGSRSEQLHVTVGPVRSEGPMLWRDLSWRPALRVAAGGGAREAAAASPPRLDGQLGCVTVSTARCPGGRSSGESGLWLLLAGSYVPPLGVLGLPSDEAAVERAASACANAMIAQIADRLRRLAVATPPAPAGACGTCGS